MQCYTIAALQPAIHQMPGKAIYSNVQVTICDADLIGDHSELCRVTLRVAR